MLFTDGLILASDGSDLIKIDSEVSDIASACQPTIALSDVIADAQLETASFLLGLGGRFWGRWQNMYNGPDYGYQALFTESANRPRYSLGQIVVNDVEYPAFWSELKRYLVYVTLFNFYRDASRRPGKGGQISDRYATKRDVYEEEIKAKYLPRLKKAGIPVVGKPMSCPGALYEPNAGTWSNASNLTLVSGGSGSQDASYDIAVTWQDTTASLNNESAPSATLTIAVPAGQKVQIGIANLTAPNGTYRNASLPRMPVQPLNANQWNVYAAITGQTLTLQASVPYSTKSYALDVPTTTGAAVGVGQYPDLYFTVQQNTTMRA